MTRVMAAVVLGASLVGAGIAAQQASGWRATPDAMAAAARSQPGFNYDEAQVGAYDLPDPLAAPMGRVRTSADWPPRRDAILNLFRDTVYGRSPGRPERLAFEVLQTDPKAMAGAATLKRVSIVSRVQGRRLAFELVLFLPNRPAGRVPVFLLINNRPASNTDPTRREQSGFWPAESMIARGFGMAAIQVGQLAPDDPLRFRDGALALFEGTSSGARPEHAWGALAAWAWGASRALDYLVTDARVDAARVAVVGHSRGGKAALWAGAEDERFALVVSNESGEGGAALSRRPYGETVARINKSFPHWFTDRYKSFADREFDLPVDQHMLLALVAPRALYVASADEDLWSDPRGEFLALAAASSVFALWGEPAIATTAMPPLDTPLILGRRGYHVRRGSHNLTPYDWERFADFATELWPR